MSPSSQPDHTFFETNFTFWTTFCLRVSNSLLVTFIIKLIKHIFEENFLLGFCRRCIWDPQKRVGMWVNTAVCPSSFQGLCLGTHCPYPQMVWAEKGHFWAATNQRQTFFGHRFIQPHHNMKEIYMSSFREKTLRVLMLHVNAGCCWLSRC